jgi:hypothetical protein
MATGSGARPEWAGSRGPVGRETKLSPSGYRVSNRRRFELRVAGSFTGRDSLQDTIDLAVTEFLDRLRSDADGFVEALASAEREQQRRAGVQSVGEGRANETSKHGIS